MREGGRSESGGGWNLGRARYYVDRLTKRSSFLQEISLFEPAVIFLVQLYKWGRVSRIV